LNNCLSGNNFAGRNLFKKVKNHDEQLDRKKVKFIDFISFFSGFSQAMLVYIMAYYFKIVSGSEDVGIFYLIAYCVLLIVLLNLHKVIRYLGKSLVYFFALIASLLSLSLLIFTPPSLLGIFLIMIYLVATLIVWVALDVILESFSTDTMSGRIRGVHLTVLNAGFLLGPFISIRILNSFDFKGVFIALLVLNSVIFVLSLVKLRGVNHKFIGEVKIVDLIKKCCCNRDIFRIYYVSFCLDFFYALMLIYTSIYLLDQGISWNKIGIIFTIMLVPFVILQYPIGRLADKKMGEKELIIFSLLLMAFSSGAIYFMHTTNVWAWALILFLTRIGACMIEILRDSYFYKRIDGHDVDVINFFRTSMPVGYMVAAGISFPLVAIFSVKIVFLIIALVIFSGLYPAFRLVDSKVEKECKKIA
jgi:Na+/melibiose symporter-like transporter